MKKSDVVLNHVYAVKVGGVIRPVRLVREVERRTIKARSVFGKDCHYGGGWIGLNLKTNREVKIASAARLRYELKQCESGRWTPVTAAARNLQASQEVLGSHAAEGAVTP